MNYKEIYRDTVEDGVFVVEKGYNGSYRGVAKYPGEDIVLFDKPNADETIIYILNQVKRELA